MRFIRKVLLEWFHSDNKLIKGKLIFPCQLVFSYFLFRQTRTPPLALLNPVPNLSTERTCESFTSEMLCDLQINLILVELSERADYLRDNTVKGLLKQYSLHERLHYHIFSNNRMVQTNDGQNGQNPLC